MSSMMQQATEQQADLNIDEDIENEIDNSIQEIDILEQYGIASADIKKLKAANYYTLSSIVMSTTSALSTVKGLSEARIEKIQEVIRGLNLYSFVSARTFHEQRKAIFHITTGSQTFDELLGGGIESSSITEIFGEFRTGKTQICHTLCVTAQLPRSQGGGNGKVIYIDTEGTFRPARIIDIATRFNVDPDTVLDNICVARAYTHEHQLELLNSVSARMIEDHFSLIIVDSATALFRVDFLGRGQLSDRQQRLGQFMSRLNKLASEFNVSCVITNQVVADPAGSLFIADVKKPIGGHVMAHASTTRLMLRKGKGNTRIVKIYDSPSLPEAEATYSISLGGISDDDGQ